MLIAPSAGRRTDPPEPPPPGALRPNRLFVVCPTSPGNSTPAVLGSSPLNTAPAPPLASTEPTEVIVIEPPARSANAPPPPEPPAPAAHGLMVGGDNGIQ